MVALRVQNHLQLEGWVRNPMSPSLHQVDKEVNFLEMLSLQAPTELYEN